MIQPNTLYNKLIQTDEMTKIQIQSYMYMCIDKNIEKIKICKDQIVKLYR